MDLTGMSPAEIDAAWIEARAPYYRLHDSWSALLAKAAKYRKWGGRYAEQATGFEEQAKTLRSEMVARVREIDVPFDAEWEARGGWTRAYLVPDGHIHRATACQSLYPTTKISWLPDLSGQSEEEIVTAAGMMACTFCYPSAPVEALRAAAAEEKAKDECPGSRQYAKNLKHYGQRYVRCHVCNVSTSVTSRGNLRAHKKSVNV